MINTKVEKIKSMTIKEILEKYTNDQYTSLKTITKWIIIKTTRCQTYEIVQY